MSSCTIPVICFKITEQCMIKCEIYVQLFTGPQCIWYLSSFFHHKQTTNKYSDLHTFKI